MSKSYVAALASLLVGAAVTFGQAQDAPPAPNSNAPPAPASESVSMPSMGIWDELRAPFFTEPGRGGSGVFTFDAEYVLWLLANTRTSVPVATTDVLSAQDVRILSSLGDAEHGKDDPISGARLTFGYWLVDDNPWVAGGYRDLGVEARFFFVGQRSVNFLNDTAPTIIRPFFDVNNRREFGFLVAAPGLATGNIAANAKVDIWGAEANVWKSLYYNYPSTTFGLSVMGGFRYLSADHHFEIRSVSAYNPNLDPGSAFFPLAGNTLAVQDSFTTHNRFYGGQVGIAAKSWPDPALLLEVGLKLGLGFTNEEVNITGSQLRTFANGQTVTSTGGVLALPSNIGRFGQNKFTQVPEVEVKASYRVTDHVTFSSGFSALYWSRVVRAAGQVDREVDITQIPNFPLAAGAIPTPLARPAVPFNQSDLWVLGISFGLAIDW